MALAQVNAGDKINASDINQFYNILKGVAASGESVTLIYNAAGAVILQPSSDPATGTELIQVKNNAGTVQMALSSDGKVYAGDGAVGSSGLTFELDKDTGIYRIGANTLGIATNGVERLRVDTTGVSLDGGVSYVSNSTLWGTFYWPPTATTGMVFTAVGTGSVTASTGQDMRSYATGATSGGSESGRIAFDPAAGAVSAIGLVRRMEFTVNFPDTAACHGYVLATTEVSDVEPSLTADHLGIKFIDTVISFTTADGTTEQTTDITATFPVASSKRVTVTFDGTTARCYIGTTLAATHATNVPRSTPLSSSQILRHYIKNSANANKRMFVGPTTIQSQ